tara:strand:- start:326 stop:523 length:198 start_codon:yes stop_codon:yes gene_type:complete
MSSPDIPKPPPPPPAPNQAPDEIENAIDSNAEIRKKKRKGTKQLRRGISGVQAGGAKGSGLTINS